MSFSASLTIMWETRCGPRWTHTIGRISKEDTKASFILTSNGGDTGGETEGNTREHHRETSRGWRMTERTDRERRENKDYTHTHTNEGIRNRWGERGGRRTDEVTKGNTQRGRNTQERLKGKERHTRAWYQNKSGHNKTLDHDSHLIHFHILFKLVELLKQFFHVPPGHSTGRPWGTSSPGWALSSVTCLRKLQTSMSVHTSQTATSYIDHTLSSCVFYGQCLQLVAPCLPKPLLFCLKQFFTGSFAPPKTFFAKHV